VTAQKTGTAEHKKTDTGGVTNLAPSRSECFQTLQERSAGLEMKKGPSEEKGKGEPTLPQQPCDLGAGRKPPAKRRPHQRKIDAKVKNQKRLLDSYKTHRCITTPKQKRRQGRGKSRRQPKKKSMEQNRHKDQGAPTVSHAHRGVQNLGGRERG